MTTLAADVKRPFGLQGETFEDIPVIASDIIYEGAAVGESSSTGTARPLVGGDTFFGFAVRRADNSSGSAGDIRVRVMTSGEVKLPITNVDNINDLGDTVYASDDNAFTLASTGNTAIGKLVSYNSVSGYGVCRFEAAMFRSI